MITGYGTVESAVEAIRPGAFDFLTKPLIDEELEMAIQRALNQQQGDRGEQARSRPSSTSASAWRTSSATTTACCRSTT